MGLALLVLFFITGVIKTCGSFSEIKRPEQVLKLFIRFAVAKVIVTYGLKIMMSVFSIIQGVINTIMTNAGISKLKMSLSLPSEIINTIEDCGFLESVPLWAVAILGGIFMTVLSIIMILSVYGRFFKIYMYTAISPIPLSTSAGEPTQNIAKSFIKSYCAVCLEGAIIILACVIFSGFAVSPPVIDSGMAAINQVWLYLGEVIFNMCATRSQLKRLSVRDLGNEVILLQN